MPDFRKFVAVAFFNPVPGLLFSCGQAIGNDLAF